MQSLRLLDFSDRELLHVIYENAQDDGWADPADIVDALGIDHKHPRQCVGSRFGWLRKKGVLERDDAGFVRLTEIGEASRAGKLTASQERQLDRLGAGDLLMLTRWLTKRQSRE